MNHVLRYAEEKQCCVDTSDTPNSEVLMAAIRATEKREEPIIIQHTQLHECETPIHIIDPVTVRMAKGARVPVCVMLDHSEDLDYVRKTLDLSLPVIMYDGPSLAHKEDMTITREVVAMTKTCNVDAKAEIDTVTGHEGKTFAINDVSDVHTGPELAAGYVRDTDIDVPATSVGTAHGFYITKPKLDFDRTARIKELTGLPSVMYGGSGISIADIRRAIRYGIHKIDYFSYMSNVGAKAVKKLLEEKEVKYFHGLVNAAAGVMEQDVLSVMSMSTLEQI